MAIKDMRSTSPGSVPVMHAHAHEFRLSLLLLRALVLVSAIVSVSLLVTDRQTSSVPVPFFGLTKPLYITRTARYELVKGLRYFCYVLLLVMSHSFLQLLFNVGMLVTKGSVVGSKAFAWASFILDSAMAYLLVSGASVATELGYLAEKGAPEILWNKVCNHFDHFCTVYAASVVASFLAAFAALCVVAISAYHLFRLYGAQQAQSMTGKQTQTPP